MHCRAVDAYEDAVRNARPCRVHRSTVETLLQEHAELNTIIQMMLFMKNIHIFTNITNIITIFVVTVVIIIIITRITVFIACYFHPSCFRH